MPWSVMNLSTLNALRQGLGKSYEPVITHYSNAALAGNQAENLLCFLQATQKHSELCNLYWPMSNLTEQEKLKRTANFVGLEMPAKLNLDIPLEGQPVDAS
ncbi:MAG: hypothetical protein SGCHY_000596 [Lobulomycetales sp.]